MTASFARQAAALQETAHRSWPPPERPWLQGQTWEQLLFAHWRVDGAQLRPHLADGVELETFDGSAWLGITPFRLVGLRLRGTLPVPGLSSFPELNVRTYVRRGDRPGIWFFSLDADSRWAVAAARRTYRLPYHHARMRAARRDGWIEYSSGREGHVFEARYRPTGDVFQAEPGTLEHFLTERYCLWTHGPALAEIHHPPWPLQEAEAELELNTMPPADVELAGEPLCHYAERQDVVIWPLEERR
ncbi:MAG: DUF2071 domain-containing protein [Thermoleophilia bacterium]|nr:DUF2071 domain-containing protein [Thermoleophilia bacterium]